MEFLSKISFEVKVFDFYFHLEWSQIPQSGWNRAFVLRPAQAVKKKGRSQVTSDLHNQRDENL